MFSSDRNIGIIGRLVELARHYFGLQCEYIKLGAIEKSVRLITALVIVAVLALIIIMTLIFFSLAATVWLSDCIGYAVPPIQKTARGASVGEISHRCFNGPIAYGQDSEPSTAFPFIGRHRGSP